MHSVFLSEIVSKGGQGCMIGAFAGFLMGATTAAANHILFEKQPTLCYETRSRKSVLFRDLKTYNALFNLEAELRILMKYKAYNLSVFNGACALTQRIVDLKNTFETKRKSGQDAVDIIAKFHKTAMSADQQWRLFCKSIAAQGDAIGTKEAQESAMNLHVAFEHELASMRNQFQLSPQVQKPILKKKKK